MRRLTSSCNTARSSKSLRLAPSPPCDAHAAPGRLLLNLTSPLHTHWRPLNEAECPALPPYLPSLWELTHGPDRSLPHYAANIFSEEYRLVAATPEPPPTSWLTAGNNSDVVHDPIYFLRKQRSIPPTVLVLGDSVDRNGLVHFCQLFRRNITISHYHDIHRHPPETPSGDLTKGHGPKFEGWDQRGLPHLCEIPYYSEKGRGHSGVAMRVVNGFHYGMDALNEFDTPDHSDWHKPGRVEVRIEQLVVPMLEQMGGVDSVDLVQLHSGMWDLVRRFVVDVPRAELTFSHPRRLCSGYKTTRQSGALLCRSRPSSSLGGRSACAAPSTTFARPFPGRGSSSASSTAPTTRLLALSTSPIVRSVPRYRLLSLELTPLPSCSVSLNSALRISPHAVTQADPRDLPQSRQSTPPLARRSGTLGRPSHLR